MNIFTENDLNTFTKEELIELYLKKQKREKLGLVWEYTKEQRINKDTYLEEVPKYSIPMNENNSQNYLIEGDNYDSLGILKETHKGKIDTIYIDPPYNTGKTFIYEDKKVNHENSYKHSKWLSFMYDRLLLAKDLLSEDGKILISIDDYEQAQLKLMLDTIFGEENFIGQLVWLYSRNSIKDGELLTTGVNFGKLKKTKEYVLIYAKDQSKVQINRKELDEDSQIKNRVTKRGNKVHKILFKKGMRSTLKEGVFKDKVGGDSETLKLHGDMIIKDYKLVEDVYISASYSIPNVVRNLIDGKEVYDSYGQKYLDIYLTNTGVPYVVKEKKGELYNDVISGFGGSSVGTREIFNIFGKNVFSYPKPLKFMEYLLKLSTDKNSIILDFFSGSGTTGHAVMELNKKDGGNRTFILCTNNEVSTKKETEYLYNKGYLEREMKDDYNKFKKDNEDVYNKFKSSPIYEDLGIARSVTRERLKRVIEGYETPNGKIIEGIPSNFKYLKVCYN